MCVCVRARACVNVCACTCSGLRACVRISMWACACIHMCTCAQFYACACAFEYVCGCTRVTHISQRQVFKWQWQKTSTFRVYSSNCCYVELNMSNKLICRELVSYVSEGDFRAQRRIDYFVTLLRHRCCMYYSFRLS